MSEARPPLKEMTLIEHLRELRKRLFIVALAVTVGTFVAYSFSEEIFELLTGIYYRNFPGSLLIGTGPAEAFVLKLKAAIFAGIVLVSPVIFHQFWLFVEPGMFEHEKRMALPFVFCTTILFLSGVAFCYEVVLPFSFDFFYQEYKSIHVTPTVRISEHLSLMMQGLVGFGLVFELPVIAFFLGRAGVINYRMMIDTGRYAIVLIFVVSAVLTPPDAITQLLMAGPLLLLYGLSILIVKFTGRSEGSSEQSSLPAVNGENS